jgi:spore maturation protein CgeB
MIKKILYIAYKFDYGRKENGLAINYKGWFEGFKDLDYLVDGVFFDDYSQEELQEVVLERAHAEKPDLIFIILQKEQIAVKTLQNLKSAGFFTVGFFGDDHWRFDTWSSKYAPYFKACITTDKFSVDKYRNIGQTNIIRSQWASLDPTAVSQLTKYKYDLSFIGEKQCYRAWFVGALQKKGYKVECFGAGWDNGRVTYEEMDHIFRSTKINLNISNSISYDLRFLIRSPKTSLSLIKSSIKGGGKSSSQIKARNFEIPVQSGFQLTDYVPTLEDYYNIGKEVVCYSNLDEAEKLIHFYLKNDRHREIIREAGMEKARKNHTYKHRIKEFMLKIESIYEK